MYTFRTRNSPGPGSGTSTSTSWKSLDVGSPLGRAARSTCRLFMPSPAGSAGASYRRPQATVEVDRGAGDVGGPLGDQERDEVAELGGVGHAAEGHALGQLGVVGLEVALGPR